MMNGSTNPRVEKQQKLIASLQAKLAAAQQELTVMQLPPAPIGQAEREKVSVIGIGRLGLCWALTLENAGYDVVGVDIFPSYVDALNKKTFQTNEPHVMDLLEASTCFRATTDIKEAVAHSKTLYVLVATPSSGGKQAYDTAHVAKVLRRLDALRIEDTHIVIGCTVAPTYCTNVAKTLIPNCVNCDITYNPEFICQGDIVNGQWYPDMVLIGEGSAEAGDILERHHRAVAKNTPVICRMAPTSAEICKLSINCFVTTKISFANMVGDICDRTPGAEKIETLQAVGSDTRVGNKYLRPGYGYGGPCFPRDNRALYTWASTVGVDAMVSKATDKYNAYHTALQAADRMASSKNGQHLLRDVAYKPNCPVPIIEESQKLEIAEIMARKGHAVTIEDRDFIIAKVQNQYGNLFRYSTVATLLGKRKSDQLHIRQHTAQSLLSSSKTK